MSWARRAGEGRGPRRSRPGTGSGGGGRRGRWLALGLVALAVALGLWAVTGPEPETGRPAAGPPGNSATAAAPTGKVADLVVEILAVHPHDPTAYTQGLM